MKNGHSTFLGSAVLITAVVGVIGLGVWFCGAFLKRMLSSPHTFSGITITPFGYEAENLATHSYDSLRIQKNNTIIRIIKPKLDISIFSGPTMVSVNVDTVDAYLPLDPSDSVIVKNDTIEIPTFPDNVKFYVPVSIKVDQVSIATSGENSWTASNIYLKSRGEQAASIEIEKIQGDHIVRTASATFFADFEKEKIITNATIKTSEESLQFRAEAPKNNLGKLKANASASIEHPTDWIPAKIPEDLPKVGALKVKGSANIDLIKQDINYKASVETNVGALWPLEPQKITLNIEGGKKDFLADITMKNNEGGTIHLNGKCDTQLDGDFTLEVQNTNALFGPQMMPMDLQIHAAEKRGNTLHAFIETRQGSLIDANLNFNDSLLITFVADISPYEPWALDAREPHPTEAHQNVWHFRHA